jgi:hypothetical protein
MPVPLLNDFTNFRNFSFLCLNADGQFIDLPDNATDISVGTPVLPSRLPEFLREAIYLQPNVSDVFVWVHGWQHDLDSSYHLAQRLFGNLEAAITKSNLYDTLGTIPSFVAVHWPSKSATTPRGYEIIRDRAAKMTTKGDAEFFLASLLGYLNKKNKRSRSGKVLRSADGYYVHCLGHSFGCRFLTAAIRAAANPVARTQSLLQTLGPPGRRTLSVRSERLFEFTVDSIYFLQMAAPCSAFSDDLTLLVDESPVRGPVALTYSIHDRANCLWHARAEAGERGIGCQGATEPAQFIGQTVLKSPSEPYSEEDFLSLIINVDASAVYTKKGFRFEGAHSDIWYEETLHLILGLVKHSRL